MNTKKIFPKYLINKVVMINDPHFFYYILVETDAKIQETFDKMEKVSDHPLIFKDSDNYYTVKALDEQDYIVLFFYINDTENDSDKKNKALEKHFNSKAKDIFFD